MNFEVLKSFLFNFIKTFEEYWFHILTEGRVEFSSHLLGLGVFLFDKITIIASISWPFIELLEIVNELLAQFL